MRPITTGILAVPGFTQPGPKADALAIFIAAIAQ